MKESMVEEIGETIKEKKRLPKEEENKINVRIVANVLIAIVIMLYFIFLILGFHNIEKSIFTTDLKVFSIGILAISIILFETSYKKEDGKLCIYGIEVLVLAIVSLVSIYAFILMPSKFIYIMASASYLFSIYYLGKSIYIYRKMKNEYAKSLSDITEIIKKAKPEKAVETKKRKSLENREEEVVKKEKTTQEKKTVTKKEGTKGVKKTANTKTVKKEDTTKQPKKQGTTPKTNTSKKTTTTKKSTSKQKTEDTKKKVTKKDDTK